MKERGGVLSESFIIFILGFFSVWYHTPTQLDRHFEPHKGSNFPISFGL